MKPEEKLMQKPSDRIMEIYSQSEQKPNVSAANEALAKIDCILMYLDEQAELHKEDIQITQGR